MIKLKNLLFETEDLKNFAQIRVEQNPHGTKHCLKLECVACGTVNSCRCSKPKKLVRGICYDCAGVDYRGNSK